MLKEIEGLHIAIVGGGRFCKMFLEFLLSESDDFRRPVILGVADRNAQAEGVRFAREKGIFTTTDYRDLYRLPGLEVLIEMSNSLKLVEAVERTKPPAVRLIDHIRISSFWSILQIRRKKIDALAHIAGKQDDPDRVTEIFECCFDQIVDIVSKRARHAREIERGLIESKRAISQIIDGTTIPTFVIDKDHVVTHWNKACERLTGYPASEIVGTQDQWRPFRTEKRPIMADLMLDGVSKEDVFHYYGAKWKKSPLIKGAYEVEEFFPHLGDKGKWLFFTGAPIKSSDGTIIGIIETLWDRTAAKQAEAEKDRRSKMLAETARELAKSEKMLAQIIQGSTAPTFVIDKDHVITHWNGALEKLTGISAKEVVGTRKQWVRFRDEPRPSMADVVLDQLEDEEINKLYGNRWQKSALIDDAYQAEEFFPNLGKNGRWCFFRAAPIKTPDGKIVGAIETMWDRTADKIAQEERERHTRELTALCKIYRVLSGSDDLETRLDQACKEISGYLNADAIYIYTRADDGRYMPGYVYGTPQGNRCRRKMTDSDDMVTRVGQDGQMVILEDIISACPGNAGDRPPQDLRSLAYIPIRTRGKKVFGVIKISIEKSHPLTHEEKNVLDLIGNRIGAAIENSMLQDQYKKSEEKYREFFDNAPNPIFILDSRTLEIRDTNKRIRAAYGYQREELLGRSFLSLGNDDEELARGLKQISEGQSFLFTRKRHFRKGGQPIYVNINISSAKYGDSDVTIASTSDITESVEKETQLVQAGKMTTLGTMAAGMAHEINQPLNVIQVCADYFLKMVNRGETIALDELKGLAGDIRDNVQRAAGIITHMRDFARQPDVITSRININDPIQDVFKVMGHQLKVHQIDLRLDLDPDIPPILAEHNRLEQVFINLVTNAIDAIDEKADLPGSQDWERLLEIRTFSKNGRVVVTVSDTGIGMSREIVEKIFEPFFTTKEVGRGTGLGTSISYGIVKEYNGTIDVNSETGRGTTFTLRFPV